MTIAAVVIYILLAIFLGPMWPLDVVGGKVGLIGYVIVGGWASLFIGGLTT